MGVFRDFGVPRVLGASGVAGILEFGVWGAGVLGGTGDVPEANTGPRECSKLKENDRKVL